MPQIHFVIASSPNFPESPVTHCFTIPETAEKVKKFIKTVFDNIVVKIEHHESKVITTPQGIRLDMRNDRSVVDTRTYISRNKYKELVNLGFPVAIPSLNPTFASSATVTAGSYHLVLVEFSPSNGTKEIIGAYQEREEADKVAKLIGMIHQNEARQLPAISVASFQGKFSRNVWEVWYEISGDPIEVKRLDRREYCRLIDRISTIEN